MEYASGYFPKKIARYKYDKLSRIEIKALKSSDLIILNNFKDKKLLEGFGVKENIKVWSPYFDSMLEIKRHEKLENNIIYYGAMGRPENYLSAIWFIENVFNKLNTDDLKFLIIGGNPNQELYKYKSERIQILGFVDDVSQYFSKSLCLAAPLVLGAGIKIKVLEAMSAGLPVLTNEIGIEGIPATNQLDYFHCTTPEDYIDVINRIVNNNIDLSVISENSKSFVEDNFNYTKSSLDFIDWMMKL